MKLTKKNFHKEGGRLGYHIIQSFDENEITPQYSKAEISLIRQTSDDICVKYVLSVINTEKAQKTNNIARQRISKKYYCKI